MPRLVTCWCGYTKGVVDRGDTKTKCPECGRTIYIPERDEKEDHSEAHRGIGGPPQPSGKVYSFPKRGGKFDKR